MKQSVGYCYRIFLILLIGLLVACEPQKEVSLPNESKNNTLSTWLGSTAIEGFERAIKAHQFNFPQDHGSHDTFQIEWWYLTGNVSTAQTTSNNKIGAGKEFGYQVTFFRIGLAPKPIKSSSAWASQNIWMAHIALSDLSAKKHYQQERLSRGAAGLAGFQQEPFKVWLEDWRIIGTDKGKFPWQINIKNKDFKLDLTLSPLKPVVLQGENGLSQKSQQAGNASYYYSFSRLATKGSISTGGHQYTVAGLSWLDREWSTSALAKNQAGWNWFSLQLNDGSDLMVYQLFQKNGSIDPNSSGKWIQENGTYTSLKAEDIHLQPVRYWHSATGKKYAVEWNIKIPAKNSEWLIKAMLDNQEMRTSVEYWEGVVQVLDAKTGRLLGKGYLEMTGGT